MPPTEQPAPGRRAEEAVAQLLLENGFQVVARNLRLGYLELDIVARMGSLIVVVEVRERGRGARTTAFGSISENKRRRLRQAARRLWAQRYRHDASVSRLRIDAAAVSTDQDQMRIEYCPGAVTLDVG